jgi:hypothetical protein
VNPGEIIIFQNKDGIILFNVGLENETVWLTQDQMAVLFGKARSTITKHIRNIFKEGELKPDQVCRDFRHTTQHGTIKDKTQDVTVRYYTLDVIPHLNGRELLTDAGNISHELALKKSEEEFEKYQNIRKQIEKEQSLSELEEDIKKLEKKG